MSQLADNATNSPKVALSVSSATAGSGIATALEWLPPILGITATLLGIILTIILIYRHIKEHPIKMQILNSTLAEVEARRHK